MALPGRIGLGDGGDVAKAASLVQAADQRLRMRAAVEIDNGVATSMAAPGMKASQRHGHDQDENDGMRNSAAAHAGRATGPGFPCATGRSGVSSLSSRSERRVRRMKSCSRFCRPTLRRCSGNRRRPVRRAGGAGLTRSAVPAGRSAPLRGRLVAAASSAGNSTPSASSATDSSAQQGHPAPLGQHLPWSTMATRWQMASTSSHVVAGIEHRRRWPAGRRWRRAGTARLRIDADGRFVEEQQFRLAEQADGQVERRRRPPDNCSARLPVTCSETGEGDGVVDPRVQLRRIEAGTPPKNCRFSATVSIMG